jgi:LEA14-like dessication related protein
MANTSVMTNQYFYFFASLLLFGVLSSSCSSLKPIQYNGYKNFTIKDVANEPEMQIDIKLHNPNPVGATLRKMELYITIYADTIGRAGIGEKVRMKKKSDFTLPVVFASSYEQLSMLAKPGLDAALNNKEIPFHVNGQVTISKFWIFRKTFTISYADAVKLQELLSK